MEISHFSGRRQRSHFSRHSPIKILRSRHVFTSLLSSVVWSLHRVISLYKASRRLKRRIMLEDFSGKKGPNSFQPSDPILTNGGACQSQRAKQLVLSGMDSQCCQRQSLQGWVVKLRCLGSSQGLLTLTAEVTTSLMKLPEGIVSVTEQKCSDSFEVPDRGNP